MSARTDRVDVARAARCIHLAWALALVGQGEDLFGGQVGVGGDVEEVAHLVEQGLPALAAADVLAQLFLRSAATL